MRADATDQTTDISGPPSDPSSRTRTHDGVAASSMSTMRAFVERTKIGRYSLVSLLGRGSYGTVWAAYDPQLDRRVALKVLYVRGEDADAEIEQMLVEARMLAQLSHPNVVGVHDVQTLEHDREQPSRRGIYIVMEYLAGPTLTDWLDERRELERSGAVLRELLEAFEGAGRGLAAAHAEGLVHRDFKPSNVMFGADGRVRVLDFGLARPERRASQGAGKRRAGLGTPAYMSPEQHRGDELDARSDQFSFCVALHEALYGERPFAGDDHTSLGVAKLRGEVRAPPRNTKVPARLQAVVRRGMATDLEQRFASMEPLLRALLEDPVRERRRWALVGLLVAVVAGSGYGLARVQDRAASSCEAPADAFDGIWDDTTQARLRAHFGEIEAQYASQALTKVELTLDDWTQRWAATWVSACERERETKDDRARACLEQARRRGAGIVGMLREADAAMIVHASEALAGLGHVESCLERATPRARAGTNQRRAAEYLLAIEAEVVRAQTLDSLGRHQQAVEVARAAAEQAEELEDHAGLARAKRVEAVGLRAHQRYDAALAAAERSAHEAVLAGDHEELVRALLEQIAVHEECTRHAAAIAVAGVARSFASDERLGAELSVAIDAAEGRSRLQLGELERGGELLAHAREQASARLGPDDPHLADIHEALGLHAALDGRSADSEQHYLDALELRRAAYGQLHPRVAASLEQLGRFYRDQGQLEPSLARVDEALATDEAVFGADSPKLIPLLLLAAELEAKLERHDEALGRRERAVELAAGLPAHHPVPYKLYLARAASLEAVGERARAIDDLRRSHANHVQAYGPTFIDTAVVEAKLAELLRETGELDEALTLEAHALTVLARELPRDPPREPWLRALAEAQLERTLAEQAARELVSSSAPNE